MLESFFRTNTLEAGCDEAGRGPIAGPVFAAAVILAPDFYHPLLNDSKKVSAKSRLILRDVIEKEAICWSVVSISAEEIDRINILKASIYCMHRALNKLEVRPELILVDGNKFYEYSDPINNSITEHQCIVKGDAKFASIAAASILAKTYRDEYMCKAALEYPGYGWDENMGYPTKGHREAIAKIGPCSLHRKSFKLLPDTSLGF